MTARQRTVPGNGAATLPAGSNGAASYLASGENGAAAPAHLTLDWNERFRGATAAQQAEMLALAGQQGFLFAHQVPHLKNGATVHNALDGKATTLSKLLSGCLNDLAPVVARTLEFADAELDAMQQEAVVRAVSTPDVFMLQGLPGAGKSRTLAEIVHQATLNGERVLLLGEIPAAVDAVLERLADRPNVLAVRFLETGERAEQLSTYLQGWTPEERQRRLREDVLASAQKAVADADDACRRHAEEESCWQELRRLADRLAEQQEKVKVLADRAAGLPKEVAAEAEQAALVETGWLAELRIHDKANDEAVAALDASKRKAEASRSELLAELEADRQALERIRPLAEVKRRGRWWTLGWWRATFSGNPSARFEELEADLAVKVQSLDEIERSLAVLHAQQSAQRSSYEAERSRCLLGEANRRKDAMESERAAQSTEERLLSESWQRCSSGIHSEAHRPVAATHEAVADAHGRWLAQCSRAEESRRFAREWADFARDGAAQLTDRIRDLANVLAGTTSALKQDKGFAEAALASVDLVIVDDAERFSEADLIRLSGYGCRLVLSATAFGGGDASSIGAAIAGQAAAQTNGIAGNGADTVKSTTPGNLRHSAFARLWNSLHPDVGRLPYAWFREDGRLVCRLRSVSASERGRLEREHVADFPEIELRIWSPQKSPPVLSQVAFPPGMDIGQAKAFLYRELQEAAVHGIGRSGWLREEAGSWVYRLAPHALPGARPVQLDIGLREWVNPENGRTCRLEFDAANWNRSRVDQWLHYTLKGRDLGRTIFLQIPYRQASPFREALGDIVFAGDGLSSASAGTTPECGVIEFVPVPPLGKATSPRPPERLKSGTAVSANHNGNNGSGLPKEGAGLEQDLAVNRIADRLPAEFRTFLPRKGFANYLEAQAVIGKLGEIARETRDAHPVAVIALCEGQVELLKLLASRAPELAKLRPDFGLPGQFRQREFDTVLVSLTRSHSHRAVPLCEREADLPLALSRARRRLILLGDVGALVKRGHWQGALEHQDAQAATREARRCAALVRYLQGQGTFQSGFRLA